MNHEILQSRWTCALAVSSHIILAHYPGNYFIPLYREKRFRVKVKTGGEIARLLLALRRPQALALTPLRLRAAANPQNRAPNFQTFSSMIYRLFGSGKNIRLPRKEIIHVCVGIVLAPRGGVAANPTMNQWL